MRVYVCFLGQFGFGFYFHLPLLVCCDLSMSDTVVPIRFCYDDRFGASYTDRKWSS